MQTPVFSSLSPAAGRLRLLGRALATSCLRTRDVRPFARAHNSAASSTTIDDAEIRKFTALADQWWKDADGPFAGLHQLNSVRVPIIRRAMRHDATVQNVDLHAAPLAGLSVLDIGCGGGILSEALGRLGATVTGIDASSANVLAATAHSRVDPCVSKHVTYKHTSVEALADTGVQFDGVVASEVLEHVADVDVFLSSAVRTLRPGGRIVVTTINRTVKSFTLAILGAEYVARIVPAGTHEWGKFVTPEELSNVLHSVGCVTESIQGLWYNPLASAWGLTNDTQVNYALVARKME